MWRVCNVGCAAREIDMRREISIAMCASHANLFLTRREENGTARARAGIVRSVLNRKGNDNMAKSQNVEHRETENNVARLRDPIMDVQFVLNLLDSDGNTAAVVSLPEHGIFREGHVLTRDEANAMTQLAYSRFYSSKRSQFDRSDKSEIKNDDGTIKSDLVRQQWLDFVPEATSLSEQAALAAMDAFFAEHNDHIANKRPGIVRKRDGSILDAAVVPPTDRTKRLALARGMLANPQHAERIASHMHKLVTELSAIKTGQKKGSKKAAGVAATEDVDLGI